MRRNVHAATRFQRNFQRSLIIAIASLIATARTLQIQGYQDNVDFQPWLSLFQWEMTNCLVNYEGILHTALLLGVKRLRD